MALQETKFRIADRAEMGKLASERARIEAELVAAGGGEYGFLLGMCGDLSDIIKDIDEIARKKSEKERAAFETKVKFSRKVRRKAKDLGRFEKEIVQQFEEKHITLDHGRKMAEIVKLLKSGKPEKARHDAAEFLGLIGKGERLNEIDEEISRQKSHLEKKKRFLLAQISDLEWLEAQQEIDEKKVQRHEETIEIRMKIGDMRAEHIRSLKFMPFAELIKKAKSESLEGFGFPSIDKNNAESLIAFLKKSGLDGKSAAGLLEMSGQSEQKMRHLGIDLPGFRQEILGRKPLFSMIDSMHASDFLPIESNEALAYLSSQDGHARGIVARLQELGKTAQEDEGEWERNQAIQAKRKKLAGTEKTLLMRSLEELKELEGVLVGKEGSDSKEKKSGGSLIGSILGFFKGR